MKFFSVLIVTAFLSTIAFAGFQGFNGSSNIGVFTGFKCSTGMTCTKLGGNMVVVSSPTLAGALTVTGASTLTGGIVNAGAKVNHIGWQPPSLTSGTSTTPSATTVYLSQIYIPANVTLTGIKVNSAATVGTNKYIVALFDATGAAVANSALAGVTTANADAFQTIAFTGTYAAKAPGVFWIALYVNGTTDRFRTVPAAGEFGGLAGSVTGQTFGTIASFTPPTTFTADKGPVAFTY